MTLKINCFLPCRKGSERVPRKNIKPFSDVGNGLIEIKLRQLCKVQAIDKIYLSTNDDEIINFAAKLDNHKIVIHRRTEELSSSLTSTDALVAHAVDLIPSGHILWTHVTSPFVTSELYEKIIKQYFEKLNEGYDSLMTTTEIRGFLWDDEQPINYDRTLEKWPRTQTLAPVNEVNSAAFIAPCSVYETKGDRIGSKPYLYALDKITALDVDWPEDFTLAECVAGLDLVAGWKE